MGYSIDDINFSNSNFISKILVYLAGPIFNFILALIFYKFDFENNFKLENFTFSNLCFYTNLFLGIVNLLPILPLDGGNIVKCTLENFLETSKSMKISLIISKILLILISLVYCFAVFYLKNLWLFLGIIYLWFLLWKEERKFEIFQKMLDIARKVC